MPSLPPLWKSQAGYTLLEVIIVGALVITISVIAIPVTRTMVSNARGDSAMVMTKVFLEGARNRAVAERRNMEVTVLSDNSMQIERIEVPDGTKTIVATLLLEGEAEFFRDEALEDELPPGGFGDEAINFTGPTPVMFTSDGSLIDSAGDVTNATIFVGKPDSLETARAVTILGVTGLLQTWKWRGAVWQQ
jgi:Tfp pilus assembly protein FimT